MQNLIERLTDSLASTTLDAPRPFADLGIPAEKQKAIRDLFAEVILKPAGVLVAVVEYEQQPQVVLTRRSEALKNHPGQISFPGGRREEVDDSLVTTALRESEEEIRLSRRHVEVIGYLPDYPTITGYRVTPVVGLVDKRAVTEMQVDGEEATELLYVPLSVVLDESAYEIKMANRHGVEVPVYHLEHGRADVWGATAGMLYQLCRHFHGMSSLTSSEPAAV